MTPVLHNDYYSVRDHHLLLPSWTPTFSRHQPQSMLIIKTHQNLPVSSSWPSLHILTPALLPAWSGWCDPWRQWHDTIRQLSTQEPLSRAHKCPFLNDKTKKCPKKKDIFTRKWSYFLNKSQILLTSFLQFIRPNCIQAWRRLSQLTWRLVKLVRTRRSRNKGV